MSNALELHTYHEERLVEKEKVLAVRVRALFKFDQEWFTMDFLVDPCVRVGELRDGKEMSASDVILLHDKVWNFCDTEEEAELEFAASLRVDV